jgi:peptidoglycan/LPS O-acetylase OafA/YrhL
MRGLAAVAILVFHFKNFGIGGGGLSRPPIVFQQVSLLNWLVVIRENGALAVMFFWAISGFVFMNVYAGTRPDFGKFWLNRIARLYPLHILTLLCIAGLQWAAWEQLGHWLIYPSNTLPHFIEHLFFVSAWDSSAPHSFNGPVWSVSVEVLIYGIFYLYARYANPTLVSSFAGLVLFGGLMKLFPESQIPVCGSFFFGGASAYAIFQLWPASQRKWLVILAVAAVAVCAAAAYFGRHHLPLTIYLLPVAMSLLIASVCSEEAGLRPLFRRAQAVGDITYSTYMWHTPLQIAFLLGAGLGWWQVDWAFNDAFFVGYLLLVCGLAWLSFRFIERPAQRRVRAWAGKAKDKPLIGAP